MYSFILHIVLEHGIYMEIGMDILPEDWGGRAGADDVIEEIVEMGNIIVGLINFIQEEVLGVDNIPQNLDDLGDIAEDIVGVHNFIQEEIIGTDQTIVDYWFR